MQVSYCVYDSVFDGGLIPCALAKSSTLLSIISLSLRLSLHAPITIVFLYWRILGGNSPPTLSPFPIWSNISTLSHLSSRNIPTCLYIFAVLRNIISQYCRSLLPFIWVNHCFVRNLYLSTNNWSAFPIFHGLTQYTS